MENLHCPRKQSETLKILFLIHTFFDERFIPLQAQILNS